MRFDVYKDKYLIVRTDYLHDQLGAFSLPSSRLPTDDNALVLPECRHPGVGRRANGEEMRGKSWKSRNGSARFGGLSIRRMGWDGSKE